jgi:hypothetical protein
LGYRDELIDVLDLSRAGIGVEVETHASTTTHMPTDTQGAIGK